MNAFYSATTKIFYESDGFIIDLVGDEVVAIYPPGFSGDQHARKAVEAASRLVSLQLTAASGGSGISPGVGVHTDNVYIGTVTGADAGVEDVRVLGDGVNTTARLASSAGPREALISDAAVTNSGCDLSSLERRELALKGKSVVVGARAMHGVPFKA